MDTVLDSDLYAGLKRGVTARAVRGGVADRARGGLDPSHPVTCGRRFLHPERRIHAIGAGNVIFEVQQNSDTTYRVFDWNRLGLDGRPRQLHIAESLESINFDDPEPGVAVPEGETLAACEHFRVERWELGEPRVCNVEQRFGVFTVLSGEAEYAARTFAPGEFFLVPVGSPLFIRGNGTVISHDDLTPCNQRSASSAAADCTRSKASRTRPNISSTRPLAIRRTRSSGGTLGGRPCFFLPRHGRGHRIQPHELPHRANIWALRSLGVRWIICVTAVGSLPGAVSSPAHRAAGSILRSHLADSHLLRRGIVAHVAFADPISTHLRQLLADSAARSGCRCTTAAPM
jgi:hypothetical protein